jgi:hypothetical protein
LREREGLRDRGKREGERWGGEKVRERRLTKRRGVER